MKLPLRAKFLLPSGLVLALVVGLLIWNSLRLLDDAVEQNAFRVAHEYAVTLNLTLSPYASEGRLPQLRGYLSEMLADPRDSFARYIVIDGADGQPILTAGKVPLHAKDIFQKSGMHAIDALQTKIDGQILHARAPLLLQDNQVGSLNFGISTEDLAQARNEVLMQGTLIAVAGFLFAMGLLFLFTAGIGRRLRALTGQSQRLAKGEFNDLLPEYGGDEIEVFSRSLNAMSIALRARIADLESAEKRLSESEERFRVLFDLAPIPLAVTDKEDKSIAANISLWRTFGDHRSTFGRTIELDYWDSPAEKDRVWSIYRETGAVHGEVAKVRLSDGRLGDVAIWSSSLTLGGEPAVIWALLDLTEELNAKRELRELNASLEERVAQRSAALEQANRDLSMALETLTRTKNELISAEKMASLGSLVAGIAHELNTPIGNSLLAASALVDRVKEFEIYSNEAAMKRSVLKNLLIDIAMASNLVAGSLHKAANLISSFKQVAVDQTSDQRRTFDLKSVLQDTLVAFTPRLRRANCEVTITVAETISLDSFPGSLGQVISNLLNNALLHAFDNQTKPRVLIAAQVVEGETEIEFTDNGCGMSDDVLRRIFDPFFTTKMGQGGTGLGMNIVYNIVTGMLGGRITVESVPGVGTHVIMRFPTKAPYRESGVEKDAGSVHKLLTGD